MCVCVCSSPRFSERGHSERGERSEIGRESHRRSEARIGIPAGASREANRGAREAEVGEEKIRSFFFFFFCFGAGFETLSPKRKQQQQAPENGLALGPETGPQSLQSLKPVPPQPQSPPIPTTASFSPVGSAEPRSRARSARWALCHVGPRPNNSGDVQFARNGRAAKQLLRRPKFLCRV